ncbi:MAG: hypothetical protein FIO04_06890 [Nitrosopumilales archaeon]|nr:hypothetical protein [Nitrosopumilales archaeon]
MPQTNKRGLTRSFLVVNNLKGLRWDNSTSSMQHSVAPCYAEVRINSTLPTIISGQVFINIDNLSLECPNQYGLVLYARRILPENQAQSVIVPSYIMEQASPSAI